MVVMYSSWSYGDTRISIAPSGLVVIFELVPIGWYAKDTPGHEL